MESLELSDVCRICLEHNVILNWNDEMFQVSNISYKDCYYKYTGLEENDSDPFPKNLCQKCSTELKNAYLLFKRALGSFKILRVTLKDTDFKTEENSYMEILEHQIETKFPDQFFDYNLSDELSEIDYSADEGEEEIYLNLCEDVSLGTSENVHNADLPNSDSKGIQPMLFIDMRSYESSNGSSEQKPFNTCSFNTSSFKKDSKGRKGQSSCEAVEKQRVNGEFYDVKLPKEMRTNIINKQKNIYETLPLEQQLDDNCDIRFSAPTSNKPSKIRKKNLLMCSYCSLKVDGTNKLKKHEATHSEDRKRTETCPQCGIKLYNKMALHNHMKIHDENRQKNYKCEFCEKAFYNRGALNVHRRIHLGLMVTCQICSKEFYRQIDLDKHLLKHSVSPLQRSVGGLKYTVQCQYCDDYVPTNKWKEHKAVHLGQPQVKCKICDKNFFARSKCVKHLQRLHKKKEGYEEFIHYYVNCTTRMSHLIIKQQEIVKPLTTTLVE